MSGECETREVENSSPRLYESRTVPLRGAGADRILFSVAGGMGMASVAHHSYRDDTRVLGGFWHAACYHLTRPREDNA
jgi:hypothetical protein